MADIKNPWHSRPIDVHRWSDHPEVAALCEGIWDITGDNESWNYASVSKV